MDDWVGLAVGVAVVAWLLLRRRPRRNRERGAEEEARRRQQATRTGFEDDFDGFGAG